MSGDSMDEMERQAAEREVQRLFEQIVPRVAAASFAAASADEGGGAVENPRQAMQAVVFSYKIALAAVTLRPRMMALLTDFTRIARESRDATS